ncbi:MAG TPA: FAD-dependent oxidoreductase [bacterium]|nr:FAD-dependent oxidoreductase [bacterium]
MKRPGIIVVGGGAAGAMCALKAVEAGVEVTLFSRFAPRRSSSSLSQSGFNAALDSKGEGDSPALHARESLVCGDFLAFESEVAAMCEAAPMLAGLFDRMGVAFARTPEGLADLVRLPGSTKRRSAFSFAGAGQQVAAALDAQLRRLSAAGKIRLLEGWEFLSLVVDDGGRCRGVVSCDRSNMDTKAFPAEAVVVASGGFAGLWGGRSAKPDEDGSALGACFEQGAILANPEFVQISPFAVAGADESHPVTALMLAAGARAEFPREGTPWRFMEERFPKGRGMVPDDVAVRALLCAASGAGQTPGAQPVVDFTDVDQGRWGACFRRSLDLFGRLSFDEGPALSFKVSPAVVRTLGGLKVNSSHETSVPGLFAAGSAAAIYHGACALPGNELTASAFGGLVAGVEAARFAQGLEAKEVTQSLLDSAREREEDENGRLAGQQGGENAHVLMRELSGLLSSSAFASRENGELSRAAEKIEELSERLAGCELLDRSEWANAELISMRAIERGFKLARAVVAAARSRDESRGVHYKPAFPKRDDAGWRALTKASWSDGEVKLDFSEKVEGKDVEPAAREY